MNKKYLIPLLLFLALVVLLAYGLTRNPKILPSTFIGHPAPTFSLVNVIGGNSTDVSAYKSTFNTKQLLGQRWVLNVWASWCVACRVEHPLLQVDLAMDAQLDMPHTTMPKHLAPNVALAVVWY